MAGHGQDGVALQKECREQVLCEVSGPHIVKSTIGAVGCIKVCLVAILLKVDIESIDWGLLIVKEVYWVAIPNDIHVLKQNIVP
mgnify:CR=1 FL=1